MAKEKRSFLERLTGARSDNEEIGGRSMPIYTDEEDVAAMEMNRTARHTPITVEDENSLRQEESAPAENDGDGQLTIDMYQTDQEIVIKSTIAGVKPEDLDVAINNDMITIRGERSNEEEVSGDGYYYQECYWGSFSRSVVLPVDVLPDKAEASLKNGILTVRLPKAATNKVKKIQVRGF